MLSARISGNLVKTLANDDEGRPFCSIYSDYSRRGVRVAFRNKLDAQRLAGLPRGTPITVSGELRSRAKVNAEGLAQVFLTIIAHTVQLEGDSDHE
jgi:hypothetical protein